MSLAGRCVRSRLTASQIFDVIEDAAGLWLAINQDDPSQEPGWIWPKHFAKLAPSDL